MTKAVENGHKVARRRSNGEKVLVRISLPGLLTNRSLFMFLLLGSLLDLAAVAAEVPAVDQSRNDRLLSMFTVVRLRNNECTALSGEQGVCNTLFQCKKSGGTPSGGCAAGFGVCCLTHLACGGSTGNNATYLQSPGYRNTFNYAGICTYTINLRADVCQLRLDIAVLDLAPPDTTGNCQEDFLYVSQDTKFVRLCGRTIDNHFYLDVDYKSGRFVTFTFTTSDVRYNRRWNIRVSQICCDQLSLAPSGCGQYYTEPTGVIKGFNHDSDAANDRILSGLNYAVCVRKELGHCSITYEEESYFQARCGDTFERPFYIGTGNSGIQPPCINPAGLVIHPSPIVTTQDVLGPQYFYVTTSTDTANTHLTSDSGGPYNYLLNYVQNMCS